MTRWFNIGGPCNPAKHYMLSATDRLPDVVSLIRKEQYFVVHAPRQCGKTTAFQSLADEINARGEMVALWSVADGRRMVAVGSCQDFVRYEKYIFAVAGGGGLLFLGGG